MRVVFRDSVVPATQTPAPAHPDAPGADLPTFFATFMGEGQRSGMTEEVHAARTEGQVEEPDATSQGSEADPPIPDGSTSENASSVEVGDARLTEPADSVADGSGPGRDGASEPRVPGLAETDVRPDGSATGMATTLNNSPGVLDFTATEDPRDADLHRTDAETVNVANGGPGSRSESSTLPEESALDQNLAAHQAFQTTHLGSLAGSQTFLPYDDAGLTASNGVEQPGVERDPKTTDGSPTTLQPSGTPQAQAVTTRPTVADASADTLPLDKDGPAWANVVEPDGYVGPAGIRTLDLPNLPQAEQVNDPLAPDVEAVAAEVAHRTVQSDENAKMGVSGPKTDSDVSRNSAGRMPPPNVADNSAVQRLPGVPVASPSTFNRGTGLAETAPIAPVPRQTTDLGLQVPEAALPSWRTAESSPSMGSVRDTFGSSPVWSVSAGRRVDGRFDVTPIEPDVAPQPVPATARSTKKALNPDAEQHSAVGRSRQMSANARQGLPGESAPPPSRPNPHPDAGAGPARSVEHRDLALRAGPPAAVGLTLRDIYSGSPIRPERQGMTAAAVSIRSEPFGKDRAMTPATEERAGPAPLADASSAAIGGRRDRTTASRATHPRPEAARSPESVDQRISRAPSDADPTTAPSPHRSAPAISANAINLLVQAKGIVRPAVTENGMAPPQTIAQSERKGLVSQGQAQPREMPAKHPAKPLAVPPTTGSVADQLSGIAPPQQTLHANAAPVDLSLSFDRAEGAGAMPTPPISGNPVASPVAPMPGAPMTPPPPPAGPPVEKPVVARPDEGPVTSTIAFQSAPTQAAKSADFAHIPALQPFQRREAAKMGRPGDITIGPGPVAESSQGGGPLPLGDVQTGTQHMDPAKASAPVPEQHGRQAEQIIRQIAPALRILPDGVAELTLSPEELGRLRLSMVSHGDRMIVQVAADRPETLDLLRRHIDHLGAALREAGFANVDYAFSEHRGQGGAAPASAPGTGPPDIAEAETAPPPLADTGSRLDLRL